MTQKDPDNKIDSLSPPSNLPLEERWVVRIHNKDMGPFSLQGLYPMLLRGEIDPDTLILDQNRFTKVRLKEITELRSYLHLHNTQNPILLEEQRRLEKDQHWKEKGRFRTIMLTTFILLLSVGGGVSYYYLRPNKDVYMEDGDYQIAMTSFKGVNVKDSKKRSWAYKRRVRRGHTRKGGGKGKKSGGGGMGGSFSTMDFSTGKGGGIPRAKLSRIIQRRIRSVVSCITAQKRRDKNFTGATIRFTVAGSRGKVGSIGLEDTYCTSRVLKSCILRRSRRWNFPRFSGTAHILIPLRIQRQSRW